jgi:hypothetical protein
MKTIFYLENRGGNSALYHFIVLNLGGLFYITNNQYNVTGPHSNKLNDRRVVYKPSSPINYPITIYLEVTETSVLKNIIKETFNILNDKFILITSLPEGNDYEIINIYGEPCYLNEACNNPTNIFPYLRELFLSRITIDSDSLNQKIYIGRKISVGSNTYHQRPIRTILNEDRFIENLKKKNIKCVYLEDLTMENKIKLFNSAELIISTNSSALTCLLWCNKNVKVIEILNKNVACGNGEHYKLICNTLGLSYYKYSNIKDDNDGNFVIEDTNNIYNFIDDIIKLPI